MMYNNHDHSALTEYLGGTLNLSSLSTVEVLTVSELPREVIFFFKDMSPCHGQRSWYTGTERLRGEEFDENNGTCVSQLNLTITSDFLSPKMDVIFSRVNGDYSSIKLICAENKTANFIKLQRGDYIFHCNTIYGFQVFPQFFSEVPCPSICPSFSKPTMSSSASSLCE